MTGNVVLVLTIVASAWMILAVRPKDRRSMDKSLSLAERLSYRAGFLSGADLPWFRVDAQLHREAAEEILRLQRRSPAASPEAA